MKTAIYLTFLVLFIIVDFPLFFFGWLCAITFDKKRVLLKHISIGFSRGLMLTNPWWRIKVEGLENLDRKKPHLIVINHRSLYDIPLVNTLPINMRWISKKEVYKMPIIGPVLYFRGDIAISRGDANSTRTMMTKSMQMLKDGVNICIFPEGTRSQTGTVQNFKEGAFILAKKSGVPMTPVVVHGTWEAENKGKKGLKNPNTFKIKILPEISVDTIKSMSIRELSAYTHDIIYKEHYKMAPWLYELAGQPEIKSEENNNTELIKTE